MNKFVDGVDYTYVLSENDKNAVHIKLLTGEFKDTIFKYGKVGIDEKEDNAYLQFDFDVIESPIKKVSKQLEFRNHIGDLLMNIIMSKLDMEEGYIDENRTDDTEESDTQRGVLS
jgi:hypothetical protein